MKQKINMSKKKFRIGDLAKELQVKKFVIRFWEKEFALKSDRSQGGQRYYTEDDFKAFTKIKHLLYQQGYTIAGAKLQLDQPPAETQPLKAQSPVEASPRDLRETNDHEVKAQPPAKEERSVQAATRTIEKRVPYIPKDFLDKVGVLKQKLLQLHQALE